MQKYPISVPGYRHDAAARIVEEYINSCMNYVAHHSACEFLYFYVARETGLSVAEVERVLIQLEGSLNAVTVVRGDFDRACREATERAVLVGRNMARMSHSARMAAEYRKQCFGPQNQKARRG